MRLVACDDHGLFLDALVMVLTELGHDVVAATESLDEAVSQTAAKQPDVCLLDVAFGGRSRMDAVSLIRRDEPLVGLLLLTGMASEDVWCAYDAGAVDGVVNKVCGIEVLERAIHAVASGERVVEGFTRRPRPPVLHSQPRPDRLTEREREVLRLLTRGVSTDQMARELGVSINTVRTHVQNVLHKLGVNGRSKAVHLALTMDLASLPAVAI